MNRREFLIAAGAALVSGGCAASLDRLKSVKEAIPAIRTHMQEARDAIHSTLETPHPLQIFSKNVNGVPFIANKREKHEAAMEEFLASQSDIGLFQEVIDKNRLRYYQNQGYHTIHARLNQDFPWNRGGLLTLSRKRPDDVQFMPFDEQGEILSMQLSDRTIQKGVLTAFYKKQKLAVMNTHLVASYGQGEPNNPANLAQVEQLKNYIAAVKAQGWQVVIGGDFNFTENTPQYALLSQVVTDQTQDSGPTHNSGKRIDHIWDTLEHRPTKTAKKDPRKETVYRDLSDHRGIIHQIILSSL